MNPEQTFEFVKKNLKFSYANNAAVFNTMRILKRINPGDTYYEAYLGHYSKRKDTFVDYYHLLWNIGSGLPIKNIMEIGCRTGISICQLLSSMMDYKDKKAVLFDIFNDGYVSPAIVKMNLKALNLPLDMVEFVVGNSMDTVIKYKENNLDMRFDYILVDGCHEKAPAFTDLVNVVPMLNQGGILIFDDISKDGCDLIDVWNEFKEINGNEFYFTENLDGKGVGVGIKK